MGIHQIAFLGLVVSRFRKLKEGVHRDCNSPLSHTNFVDELLNATDQEFCRRRAQLKVAVLYSPQ